MLVPLSEIVRVSSDETWLLKAVEKVIQSLRDHGKLGALKIRCECAQMAQGQLDGTSLPPMTYHFLYLDAYKHEYYVHSCLQNIHDSPGLKHREILKLKRAVVEAIQRPYEASDSDKVQERVSPALTSDLLHNKFLVETAVRAHLARIQVPAPPQFTFEIEALGQDTFSVTTDLSARAGISPDACHGALEAHFSPLVSWRKDFPRCKRIRLFPDSGRMTFRCLGRS